MRRVRSIYHDFVLTGFGVADAGTSAMRTACFSELLMTTLKAMPLSQATGSRMLRTIGPAA
jgi:hypothetical protein